MLIASTAPVYVAYRVRRSNRTLFTLSAALACFTISHGLYHLVSYLGMYFLAEVFFWPLGALLLLLFGILYWRTGV